MAPAPQEPISEITEISDIDEADAPAYFVAAVILGMLAGTASLFLVGVVINGAEYAILDLVGALMFFTPIVGLFTLAGMILIGLPITFLLRAAQHEHRLIYGPLGAASGFLALVLVLGIPTNAKTDWMQFGGSGAIAGFVAAFFWGRWRERVAKAQQAECEELAAQKPPNPIHDLIH